MSQTATAHREDRSAPAVAVLGTGGIGGLLAVTLVRAGQPVIVVGRPASVAAINDRGLSLRSRRFGDAHVTLEALTRLERPVATLIVTVKATGLEDALGLLDPGACTGAEVIPLLNGVEHVEVIASALPRARMRPGTIKVEATRVSPTLIEQTSPFAAVELAATEAGHGRAPAAPVAEALARAGFEVALRNDPGAMLWQKLAFLAPVALLTTASDATVGEVRVRRRDELTALAAECVAVARAHGADVSAQALLAAYDAMPPQTTTSMHRDARAGRPLELDAVGGAVIRAAQRAGIAAPALSRTVEALAGTPARC